MTRALREFPREVTVQQTEPKSAGRSTQTRAIAQRRRGEDGPLEMFVRHTTNNTLETNKALGEALHPTTISDESARKTITDHLAWAKEQIGLHRRKGAAFHIRTVFEYVLQSPLHLGKIRADELAELRILFKVVYGPDAGGVADEHSAGRPKMPRKPPLEVLKLKPGSSIDEIRAAYWKAAKSCHPDVADSPDIAKFIELTEAYEALIPK